MYRSLTSLLLLKSSWHKRVSAHLPSLPLITWFGNSLLPNNSPFLECGWRGWPHFCDHVARTIPVASVDISRVQRQLVGVVKDNALELWIPGCHQLEANVQQLCTVELTSVGLERKCVFISNKNHDVQSFKGVHKDKSRKWSLEFHILSIKGKRSLDQQT